MGSYEGGLGPLRVKAARGGIETFCDLLSIYGGEVRGGGVDDARFVLANRFPLLNLQRKNRVDEILRPSGIMLWMWAQ